MEIYHHVDRRSLPRQTSQGYIVLRKLIKNEGVACAYAACAALTVRVISLLAKQSNPRSKLAPEGANPNGNAYWPPRSSEARFIASRALSFSSSSL